VPFGGRLVIGRSLREGEAVVDAGIDLDLCLDPVGLEGGIEGRNGFGRRPDIDFGAGEVEFPLALRAMTWGLFGLSVTRKVP